jgi:mRNA-degrading endonuclease RelE of RelBE toxin-antitoxin system
MSAARFEVRTTSAFDRMIRKLRPRHPELTDLYERAVNILEADPYHASRSHPIKKLADIAPGDGQYRIRLSRFRFRYDIEGQAVYLKRCSLRREDSYN